MAGTSPAVTRSTSLENALASSGPTTDAIASRARGAISIRNVTKVYDPDGVNVLAVENCSVDIAPGEFCVVVGPSGCGKTTLLNAIAGFHDITAGEILLDGRSICTATHTAEPGADRMVVFQNGALFPWSTVLNNVAYGPIVQGKTRAREARRLAEGLLGELGLAEIGGRYPNELSSGMRRRAEIARALINDPDVLLLDEPFRAMDALTKGVAQEFLLRAYDRVRKTIFFITHDLEEALFLADRVLVMTTRPGRIKQVLNVDFERPRSFRVRASKRYLELKGEVFEAVREEAIKAFEAGERELA
jgi:NitT/TauT family transport system ATP-binding protein